jgi:hypothetical protein
MPVEYPGWVLAFQMVTPETVGHTTSVADQDLRQLNLEYRFYPF